MTLLGQARFGEVNLWAFAPDYFASGVSVLKEAAVMIAAAATIK